MSADGDRLRAVRRLRAWPTIRPPIMARVLERIVIELVRVAHDGRKLATPDWLERPGRAEVGRRCWRALEHIYNPLTDMDIPEVMPSPERRTVDCVLQCRGESPRIVECDDKQHFNRYRALTIRSYPRTVAVSFDSCAWLRACGTKRRLEGRADGQ